MITSTRLILKNSPPLFIQLLLSSKQRITERWDRNLREHDSLRTHVQFVLSVLNLSEAFECGLTLYQLG